MGTVVDGGGLVIPASGSITASQITDSTATGRSLVTATDAAAARSAIAALGTTAEIDTAYSSTIPLTSSAGWTITPGGAGSGTITGGTYTSTIPVGTTSGTGSFVERAWPSGVSPSWEIQARVEITVDTDGELLAGVGATWGASGNLLLYVRGAGSCYLYQDGAWGFLAHTITGSIPVDGTGWVRYRVSGSRVQVWSGIGSGSTPPTSWKLMADVSASVLLGLTGPTLFNLSGFSNNTHSVPSGTTVLWRSAVVRSLGA